MIIGVNLTISGSIVLSPPEETGDGLGPELWPQPDFDSATGLTLNGWSVEDGVASSNAQLGWLTATALDPLTSGTYRAAYTVLANGGGDVQLQVGGQLAGASGDYWLVGEHTLDFNVSTVSNQIIRLKDFDEVGVTFSAFSLKLVEAL